jgi:hypothetical protein
MEELQQNAFNDIMGHCWQPAINVLTKSGTEMPTLDVKVVEDDMEVVEINAATQDVVKKIWLNKCWSLWMKHHNTDDQEMEQEKPNKKCPFKKWRQYMREAWDELMEELGVKVDKMTDEEQQPSTESTHDDVSQEQASAHPWAETRGPWHKFGGPNGNFGPQWMRKHGSPNENDPKTDEEQRMSWIHQCHHIWREQVMAKQPKGKGHGPKAAILEMKQPEFRAFLRQCWQPAIQILKKAGKDMPKLKPRQSGKEDPEEAETHGQPLRKVWIDRCWALWQEVFQPAKDGNQHEAEHLQGTQPWKGGPFKKWRNVLIQGWKMLKEELGIKDESSVTLNKDQDKNIQVEEQMQGLSLQNEETPKPDQKQQPFRNDWIQSCRLLWRTQVMASLPENQPRSPQLVMQAMKQPAFRKYMRQCWQSGLQILKKAGVALPKQKTWKAMVESSEDSEDPENQNEKKPVPPRKKWIDACWVIWQEDISSKKGDDGADGESGNKPNPGRPWGIQKWRTFMRKSWSLMLQELGVEELPKPENGDNTAKCMNVPWAHYMLHGGRGGHGGRGVHKWYMMKHWGPHGQGHGFGPMRGKGRGMMRGCGGRPCGRGAMPPKMWVIMKQKHAHKPVCPAMWPNCPMETQDNQGPQCPAMVEGNWQPHCPGRHSFQGPHTWQGHHCAPFDNSHATEPEEGQC